MNNELEIQPLEKSRVSQLDKWENSLQNFAAVERENGEITIFAIQYNEFSSAVIQRFEVDRFDFLFWDKTKLCEFQPLDAVRVSSSDYESVGIAANGRYLFEGITEYPATPQESAYHLLYEHGTIAPKSHSFCFREWTFEKEAKKQQEIFLISGLRHSKLFVMNRFYTNDYYQDTNLFEEPLDIAKHLAFSNGSSHAYLIDRYREDIVETDGGTMRYQDFLAELLTRKGYTVYIIHFDERMGNDWEHPFVELIAEKGEIEKMVKKYFSRQTETPVVKRMKIGMKKTETPLPTIRGTVKRWRKPKGLEKSL